MEKKFEEDDGLKKLLEEQYIKEAEALEAALFSDEEFKDYEASDEEVLASYDKLVARLKAEGIYREDEDSTPIGSDPKGDAEKKVIPMPAAAEPKMPKKRRHYRIARVAGFGLVSVLCIFAASMTSEANRTYFVNGVRYLVGDDTRIIVDNNAENESPNVDEYAARDRIESELGIELPRFLYRPRNFEFVSYEVDFFSGLARLEYAYNENIIAFVIDKEDENSASVIDSEHGDIIDSVEISAENIMTSIKMIQGTQDNIPNYSVRWEKDNVIYTIGGKMEIEEFKKLIEKIKF